MLLFDDFFHFLLLLLSSEFEIKMLQQEILTADVLYLIPAQPHKIEINKDTCQFLQRTNISC